VTDTENLIPEFTETLNALLSRAASEWSREDRLQMIEGFRAQREQWNELQSSGSRKRITSKQIPVSKKKVDLALAGLKL
jgi:hypothetical protein